MKHHSGWLRIFVLISIILAVSGSRPVTAHSLSPQNTILVTTVLDEFNTTGSGTGCALREAIESANTESAFGGCDAGVVGADTITFKTGINHIQLSIDGGASEELSNSIGDLNITSDMTIQGNGQYTTIIDASYQTINPSRIFRIENSTLVNTVVIMDLSLWSGDSGDFGGGSIYNKEYLTLEDVAIKNSHSSGYGGAINTSYAPPGGLTTLLRHCDIENSSTDYQGGGVYAQFSLTVEDSIFYHNSTASPSDGSGGGGIYSLIGPLTITGSSFIHNTSANDGGNLYVNASDHTTTIEDSIFTEGLADGDGGNIYAWSSPGFTVHFYLRRSEISLGTAAHGGGISNNMTLSMENVTTSGNNANLGGGLYAASDHSSITMNSSTLVYNGDDDPGYGDGIYNNNGPFQFVNSIIAFNGYSGIAVGHGWDCGGSLSSPPSLGHNLSSGDSCYANMPASGDQAHTDPLISPLNRNGGFSQTHALSSGSPAIDSGDEYNCPETDQRGWFRPMDGDAVIGAVCDKGAYEYSSLFGYLPLIKK